MSAGSLIEILRFTFLTRWAGFSIMELQYPLRCMITVPGVSGTEHL
jgi:hypothetical protein